MALNDFCLLVKAPKGAATPCMDLCRSSEPPETLGGDMLPHTSRIITVSEFRRHVKRFHLDLFAI